jgi:ATP-dependent exoDNAse (exonuclease V) beta subunit
VAATRLGTLMHRALERIEWLDEGDARASAIVEALGLSSAVEERTTTNSLSVALSDPSVRRVLTHDRYAGWDADRLLLRREVRAGARLPELARDRECLFAGFVDRLVVGLRSGRAVAAEVIDFKSDTIEPGQIESRRERYAPQIDAYRRIIADQFELRESSVRGTLVFLGAGRVVSWP